MPRSPRFWSYVNGFLTTGMSCSAQHKASAPGVRWQLQPLMEPLTTSTAAKPCIDPELHRIHLQLVFYPISFARFAQSPDSPYSRIVGEFVCDPRLSPLPLTMIKLLHTDCKLTMQHWMLGRVLNGGTLANSHDCCSSAKFRNVWHEGSLRAEPFGQRCCWSRWYGMSFGCDGGGC